MTSQQTKTPSWLDPFRKILELEEARSFDNTAVMGGLDRFVQHWADSMNNFVGDAEARVLVQVSYAQMSPDERSQWAARWKARLPGEQDPGELVREASVDCRRKQRDWA